MIVIVHTFKSRIRHVEIPDYAIKVENIQKIIDVVYRCGQNEHKEIKMPSVGPGDVAEYNGKYYLFLAVGGAQEITKEELDILKQKRG